MLHALDAEAAILERTISTRQDALRIADVASAERSVAAANARVGVAVAAFYPDVRLTGANGFETANLGDIFAGQSLIRSVGPSITVPIFEGGRNSANLQNARTQYEETVNRYRAQTAIPGGERDPRPRTTFYDRTAFSHRHRRAAPGTTGRRFRTF
jgi:outer membrane protein TolC